MITLSTSLRRAAKATFAKILEHTGARPRLSQWSHVSEDGVRVLIVSYHRIVADFATDAPTGLSTLMTSRDTFRRQVRQLCNAFEVVSLDTALEVLAGRRRAARDLAVITFDDGYRDNFQHAYPVLREAAVPAHVFLPTDYIGTERALPHDRLYRALQILNRDRGDWRDLGLDASAVTALAEVQGLNANRQIDRLLAKHPTPRVVRITEQLERRFGLLPIEGVPDGARPLSWDQCREMQAHGVDFGGHTAGHTVLVHESPDAVVREIGRCSDAIAEHLGSAPRHFAYPNGYHHPAIVKALRAAHFISAVTTEDRPNRPGAGSFRLGRKVLWEDFSLGAGGRYSDALTACHFDDVFGTLALNRPVSGLGGMSPSD